MEVCIDSRLLANPSQTLFFALKGKNHDGHDYIEELYKKGVRDFVISEEQERFNVLKDAHLKRVDNVLDELQAYATEIRSQSNAEIIAITGSNGKTIVKEWLYQLLSGDFQVYRSPRSYNSQVGVPLSLCGIEKSTEIAIIEAGISQWGEMEKLERMIKPNIGIFTHLGDAHGENFDSLEAKLAEKAKLFKNCQVIIGREGEAIQYITYQASENIQKMIWGQGEKVDVKTHILKKGEKEIQVNVQYLDKEFSLTIPFSDEASFENCMNAVCVLLLKNISIEDIQQRVKSLHPIATRLEMKEGINNCLLINDYYNSDLVSFKIALNTLKMQDESRSKTLILSDLEETGKSGSELYPEIASLVAEAGVKLFIGIGKNLSDYKNLFLMESRFYQDTESFLKVEQKTTFQNQVILIKGARKFQFEYIAGFLQKRTHGTILEVDMDAMIHNFTYFRSLLKEDTKLAVMVKAFSYGSGSGEVANLLQHQGVDYLMVAFADEGVTLRAEGISIPIAVMNPEPEAFDSMIEFNLEPEIYSISQLELFNAALLKHGISCYPVHLKINTGMNRSGIEEEDLSPLFEFFSKKQNIILRSVFSHLAASDEEIHDEFTLQQIQRFDKIANQIQSHFDYKIMKHILNSGAIERFNAYTFDMVRLGIGLHGVSVTGAPLLPVSTFKTYISSIRNVKSTETVGYGRKGVLTKDSKIAVVPVGYADGLNRHLGNGKGEMFVKGKRVPTVGNICMDATMIDVSEVNVQVGDEVEIFGKHISIMEVAQKLDTIPYEILTGIAHRVKRVYFKE